MIAYHLRREDYVNSRASLGLQHTVGFKLQRWLETVEEREREKPEEVGEQNLQEGGRVQKWGEVAMNDSETGGWDEGPWDGARKQVLEGEAVRGGSYLQRHSCEA